MSNTPPPAPQKDLPPQGLPQQPGQPGMMNLIITVLLLILGAFNIFGNIRDFLSPGMLINAVLAQLHVSTPSFPVVTYTPTETTAIVGAVLLTLQAANYGFIVWLSLSRLRARKFSFWVPVLGAMISACLVFLTLLGLMLADPTVRAAIVAFGSK